MLWGARKSLLSPLSGFRTGDENEAVGQKDCPSHVSCLNRSGHSEALARGDSVLPTETHQSKLGRSCLRTERPRHRSWVSSLGNPVKRVLLGEWTASTAKGSPLGAASIRSCWHVWSYLNLTTTLTSSDQISRSLTEDKSRGSDNQQLAIHRKDRRSTAAWQAREDRQRRDSTPALRSSDSAGGHGLSTLRQMAR